MHTIPIVGDYSTIVFMRAIHFEFLNEIFIFGGSGASYTYLDTVYCYDIKQNKWNLLDIKIPIGVHRVGCIKTYDEKYVILFGGYHDSQKIDTIQILDIDKWDLNIKVKM